MSARNTATIAFSSTLTLNESEIRAFDALVGYGDDAFIEAFKEKLGETYIRKHEAGLKSVFAAIRAQVLPALADIDQARRDLHEAMKKRIEAHEAARAAA
jgi:hypothetical protein